jgi:hypothetical protein
MITTMRGPTPTSTRSTRRREARFMGDSGTRLTGITAIFRSTTANTRLRLGYNRETSVRNGRSADQASSIDACSNPLQRLRYKVDPALRPYIARLRVRFGSAGQPAELVQEFRLQLGQLNVRKP